MSDDNQYLMQQAKKASYEARQDLNFYKAEASTAQGIANDLLQPYISIQLINDGLIEMMEIAQAAKSEGRNVQSTIDRLMKIFFEVDKLSLIQSENHNLRYNNKLLTERNYLQRQEINDLKRQLQLHTAKL